MTQSSEDWIRPEAIPPDVEPRWEKRYPGRLRHELAAFRKAGIELRVARLALDNGTLCLRFSWPLADGSLVRLKAIYPDSFPHLRPQVFWDSTDHPPPRRHASPIEGNLCLLGRDTRQWIPSLSLYKLLEDQLEQALTGTGVEDPQGEPAEYWWNALGREESFCLIDSDWDLKDALQGTLDLCYSITSVERVQAPDGGKIQVPRIRAYVSHIRNEKGKVLHSWNHALPPYLENAHHSVAVPWVYENEQMFPNNDLSSQLAEIRSRHSRLKSLPHQRPQAGSTIAFLAVAFPDELALNHQGPGWVFFQISGKPAAFRKIPNKTKPSVSINTIPAYRAGLNDILFRSPTSRLLTDKNILIVGVGALGAPVALDLARNNCGNLRILDSDCVEPGNSIRWPLGASAWGTQKVNALATHIASEYPQTTIHTISCQLGHDSPVSDSSLSDDRALESGISRADLVIDASASFGVTSLLAERCREAGVSLISLFATPTVHGGAVIRYSPDGACPICFEHHWASNTLPEPPGTSQEQDLEQPPGCSERTFIGPSYNLQELSLEALRLVIDSLGASSSCTSLFRMLSLIDDSGNSCSPRWEHHAVPVHTNCPLHPSDS